MMTTWKCDRCKKDYGVEGCTVISKEMPNMLYCSHAYWEEKKMSKNYPIGKLMVTKRSIIEEEKTCDNCKFFIDCFGSLFASSHGRTTGWIACNNWQPREEQSK